MKDINIAFVEYNNGKTEEIRGYTNLNVDAGVVAFMWADKNEGFIVPLQNIKTISTSVEQE